MNEELKSKLDEVIEMVGQVESKVGWVDANTGNIDSKLDTIIGLLKEIKDK